MRAASPYNQRELNKKNKYRWETSSRKQQRHVKMATTPTTAFSNSLLFLYHSGYHKCQDAQQFKPAMVKDVASGKNFVLLLTCNIFCITSLDEKHVYIYEKKDDLNISSIFIPKRIAQLEDVHCIASGLDHMVMLKGNGDVYGMGSNTLNQLAIKKQYAIVPELLTVNTEQVYCTAYGTIVKKKHQLLATGVTIDSFVTT